MDAKALLQNISAKKLDQIILIVLVAGLVLGVCSYVLPSKSKAEVPGEPAAEAEIEADTIIPQGFVLVPIQLENQQALLALMGSHGVLNIYQVDIMNGSKGKLIAKSIKVLRAPFNPEALSVLAPEDKAPLFMGAHHGFYGVLQNRAADDLNVSGAKKTKTLPIETFEN